MVSDCCSIDLVWHLTSMVLLWYDIWLVWHIFPTASYWFGIGWACHLIGLELVWYGILLVWLRLYLAPNFMILPVKHRQDGLAGWRWVPLAHLLQLHGNCYVTIIGVESSTYFFRWKALEKDRKRIWLEIRYHTTFYISLVCACEALRNLQIL